MTCRRLQARVVGLFASEVTTIGPRHIKPQWAGFATTPASFSFFNIFCSAPLIQPDTSNNIHQRL
jgi:hypothetical protein